MPRHIVRLTKGNRSWLLAWSTIVDAPVTFGMGLREFEDYYRRLYGSDGMRELPARLKRARENGNSTDGGLKCTNAELFALNRAGYREARLSEGEIIEWYCVRQKEPE